MAHKDIHAAILAVMQAVGYVKKTKSAGLNYSYAGEAALIAALRPEMVEQGIYCYIEDITDVSVREYTTAKGSAMVDVSLQAHVRFMHAESGTSILVVARGEGSDSGDKAVGKAMTGAYKYALRQTFLIETGDDPDKYASEERAPTRATRPRALPTPDEIPAEFGDDPAPAETRSKSPIERPMSPETLKEALAVRARRMSVQIEKKTRATVAATLEQILGGEAQRRELTEWLIGYPSLNDAPGQLAVEAGHVEADQVGH